MNSLAPIFGLAHDDHIRFIGEQRANAVAQQGMIVRDQQVDLWGHGFTVPSGKFSSGLIESSAGKGICNCKRVPEPFADSTLTAPPTSETRSSIPNNPSCLRSTAPSAVFSRSKPHP